MNKAKLKMRKQAVFIGWRALLTFFQQRVLVDKYVHNNSLLVEEVMIECPQFIERTETGEVGRKKDDTSLRDNPR